MMAPVFLRPDSDTLTPKGANKTIGTFRNLVILIQVVHRTLHRWVVNCLLGQ